MSRYDLTDFEWRVIKPLLPNKPTSRLWVYVRNDAPFDGRHSALV